MTDIVERLRSTTEQMANNCSVNMTLWCEHSGAALEAASEIERLRLSLSEARATGRREGLSEAATIADEHAAEDKLEAKILREIKDYARAKQLDCGSQSCQRLAAAIRAAMEKAE